MKETTYILWTIIIVAFFFFGKTLTASPQQPDFIIYNGDTIPIYNLILEQYLNKTKLEENESLFGLTFRDGASLNCWRGYQAIYQIENDSLYLKHIISCGELNSNDSLDQTASLSRIKVLFENKIINNRVHLDWHSGDISLPNGELLRWDGVFHKTFINEILISIKNGVITETIEIENYVDDPKRLDRYDYYSPLFTIYKNVKKKLKWRDLPDDGRFWWEDFQVTIGKDGKISEVLNLEEDAEPEYALAVKESLSDLSWDIIKKAGKPIEQSYILSLEFDFLFRRVSDLNIDFLKKEQKRLKRNRNNNR